MPWVRGSGPIAAISSSLIPATRKREKPPAPSGMPERRVARAAEHAGLVDEALEHVVDRQPGGDREDRVGDGAQR